VQGGGYVVAASGPTVVGAVHEATGGWTAPLLVVLAAIVLLGVAGTASAGRAAPRTGRADGWGVDRARRQPQAHGRVRCR